MNCCALDEGKPFQVFEGTRVSHGFVKFKTHLLALGRLVSQCLAGKHQWRRGDDIAELDVEFDLVDLHAFELEGEELVCADRRGLVDSEVWLRFRAGKDNMIVVGGKKSEMLGKFPSPRLKFEPAMGG